MCTEAAKQIANSLPDGIRQALIAGNLAPGAVVKLKGNVSQNVCVEDIVNNNILVKSVVKLYPKKNPETWLMVSPPLIA